MNELIQSTMFWAGLVVFVAVTAWAIDRFLRGMVNDYGEEASHYPHRVANELPRTLHKNDHDEVVELQDETELAAR